MWKSWVPRKFVQNGISKKYRQVIDMLGLMGDAVDNIPGIAGVGEKTAAKLLAEYGTLEKILENADNIKGALGEKVRKGKELAIMSKKLATIITNVPVEFQEEDFLIRDWNKDALKEVFTELEFKTIAQRILGEGISIVSSKKTVIEKEIAQGVQTDLFGNTIEPAPKTNGEAVEVEDTSPVAAKNINNTSHNYTAIVGDAAIKKLVADLAKQKEICFDTETTGLDANEAELVGMSFAWIPGEGILCSLSCRSRRNK